MQHLTYKHWNTTNRAVVLHIDADPPIAPLALFVFGAVVEEEAAEYSSNLDEMGFENIPLGLLVWEGSWEPDPPDHEGVSDSTHAIGTYRAPTEEELKDILAGRSPWARAAAENISTKE